MTTPPCCGRPAADTPCCRRRRHACPGRRRAPPRRRRTPAARSWQLFWHCAAAAGDPDLGRRHRGPDVGLLAGAARSSAGAGRAHPRAVRRRARGRHPRHRPRGHRTDGTRHRGARRPHADPHPVGGAARRCSHLRRGAAADARGARRSRDRDHARRPGPHPVRRGERRRRSRVRRLGAGADARTALASPSNSSAARPGRSIWSSAPTASTRAFANSRSAPSADSLTISVRICRSTPSTICLACVIARCSTTNPAAPRPCSPCAATSGRRWCCCSAARRSTSISAIPQPNAICCAGASPEWVGTPPRLIESLPDAYDFYFDEMSQVRLPRWSTGRVALLGDAAFGPSPMSGQGTSLALIGAFLLAHHLAGTADPATAFDLWEREFRPNVELNQALATDGMSTLLPATRLGIFARNQSMRVLPLLARFGRGFGGRIERASRAVTLPH